MKREGNTSLILQAAEAPEIVEESLVRDLNGGKKKGLKAVQDILSEKRQGLLRKPIPHEGMREVEKRLRKKGEGGEDRPFIVFSVTGMMRKPGSVVICEFDRC